MCLVEQCWYEQLSCKACACVHPLISLPSFAIQCLNSFFKRYMPKKRNSVASRKLKSLARTKNHVVRIRRFHRVVFLDLSKIENVTTSKNPKASVPDSELQSASDFLLEIHGDESVSEELNHSSQCAGRS